MNEEKLIERLGWVLDFIFSEDDAVICMESFEDFYSLADDIEDYLKDNVVSWKTKRIFKKYLKQVKKLKELKEFNELVSKKQGTLEGYFKQVADTEEEQECKEIFVKMLHCEETFLDKFFDLFRLQEDNENVENKTQKSSKKTMTPNEKADYYTYKLSKDIEKYHKLQEKERTIKDIKKFSKKMDKYEEKYNQLLNGEKPVDVFDNLNNAAASTVKENQKHLEKVLKFDESGYIDTQSYLEYLEVAKKEQIIEETEYQDKVTSYQSLTQSCQNFLRVMELTTIDRLTELHDNYRKYRNKIMAKVGLFGLVGVLAATSIGSCAINKSKNGPLKNEVGYESVVDEEEKEEVVVKPSQEEEQEEMKETVKEDQEEIQEEEKDNLKEEKEELELQKSILENLKETLNVSSKEEEKYADVISIGDIVTLNSNSAKVYTDIYSMNNKVNGKNAYFDMSEERLVQSLVMAKDGVVKNVCDMESYEKLVSEGYTLSGVSTMNQYSQNGEIEGRFQADSLVLKK